MASWANNCSEVCEIKNPKRLLRVFLCAFEECAGLLAELANKDYLKAAEI
ncbi:hypothetical protein PSE_4725 [Pseudovibrio sp. FO-BEG1]|nr:hypothetical protein PSE_4725 [Pseudovibrio sp. FO-BEG1]